MEDANKYGIVGVMNECIIKEKDPSVVSLELAVISSFGVNSTNGLFLFRVGCIKEKLQKPSMISTISFIEKQWENESSILRQLLAVLIIIASKGRDYTSHSNMGRVHPQAATHLTNSAKNPGRFFCFYEIVRAFQRCGFSLFVPIVIP